MFYTSAWWRSVQRCGLTAIKLPMCHKKQIGISSRFSPSIKKHVCLGYVQRGGGFNLTTSPAKLLDVTSSSTLPCMLRNAAAGPVEMKKGSWYFVAQETFKIQHIYFRHNLPLQVDLFKLPNDYLFWLWMLRYVLTLRLASAKGLDKHKVGPAKTCPLQTLTL